MPLLQMACNPRRAEKRRKGFCYPVKEKIFPYRPGTKRAALIDILSRPGGATFEECAEKVHFDSARLLQEQIYLLHTYVGFGILEDVEGRISLFTDPRKNSEVYDARLRISNCNYDSDRGSRMRGRRRAHEGEERGGLGDRGSDASSYGRCSGAEEEGPGYGDLVGGDHPGSRRNRPECLPPGFEKESGEADYPVKAGDAGAVYVPNTARFRFIAAVAGVESPEELVERAMHRFDQLCCAKLEGSRIVIVGKNGRSEEFVI